MPIRPPRFIGGIVPLLSADGTLWFASDRSGGAGDWDLYSDAAANGHFAAPDPVAELNSPIWEFNPAISADGNQLIFTSIGRDGGPGLGDHFVARLSEGAWSETVPRETNIAADEYHASLSPDGGILFFVRRGGNGDLYHVDWQASD